MMRHTLCDIYLYYVHSVYICVCLDADEGVGVQHMISHINFLFFFPFSHQTGKPHASSAPWPQVSHYGGGAIIPCVYEVLVPSIMVEQVKDEIEDTCSHPCIIVKVRKLCVYWIICQFDHYYSINVA